MVHAPPLLSRGLVYFPRRDNVETMSLNTSKCWSERKSFIAFTLCFTLLKRTCLFSFYLKGQRRNRAHSSSNSLTKWSQPPGLYHMEARNLKPCSVGDRDPTAWTTICFFESVQEQEAILDVKLLRLELFPVIEDTDVINSKSTAVTSVCCCASH